MCVQPRHPHRITFGGVHTTGQLLKRPDASMLRLQKLPRVQPLGQKPNNVEDPPAIFTSIPKAEPRDPQVKDLNHVELVVPLGELAIKSADLCPSTQARNQL